MTLQELYDKHQHEMKSYAQTDKGRYCVSANFVPGSGDSDGYMFIAEAPGTTENAKGIPLIGDAGQLLRRTLEEISFPTNRFYTNVWKWQPPKNRPPTAYEINRGTYVLIDEINILNPKSIILLGNTARDALFPNKGLARGRRYDYERFSVLSTYHPGYLLPYRSPQKLPSFKEHLKLMID